ncbi:hypothetical protein [Nocardia macrotermitis]|uniref:Uncharacterized protein n=1 Tax=Nocardia macrotermitis TaxID=2585198 RepID=A0A7K0CXK8_9NOCA|nr:hypothetical protein [Nocardia macrotermitis]MQY18249.1 hypothetical protein [Nocardia macrotermitis]
MSRTYPVQRRVVVMVAVGVIGLATVGLDVLTVMDAGPAPEPVTRSRLVDGLPGPVSCLVSTGFALSCLRPGHR